MIPLPKALQNKVNVQIMKHNKDTGHTKFTILGLAGKTKKHQLNWQVIKCKECDMTLGS